MAAIDSLNKGPTAVGLVALAARGLLRADFEAGFLFACGLRPALADGGARGLGLTFAVSWFILVGVGVGVGSTCASAVLARFEKISKAMTVHGQYLAVVFSAMVNEYLVIKQTV